jgi:hypothetical protein
MLKILERSGIKESLIMLVFAALLSEILIYPTLILVGLGAVLVWLKKRPHKILRNLLALGIFGAYWITYGKIIDPEVGINFLTTIIMLKILEKESERDQYMIFFGLLLLVSAGSLFEKNLSYVFFFALSFFILILDFYKNLKLSSSLVDLLRSLVWVLPLTAFLFFFTPRLMDPLQLGKSGPDQGEVGYTPEVNLSSVEGLVSNGKNVFQALVEKQLPSERLYWRGNTTSSSDGWNWTLSEEDRLGVSFDKTKKSEPQGRLHQSIRAFSRESYFFGLDHPEVFLTRKGEAHLSSNRALHQSRWLPQQRY